jgi:hypothetical protein
MDRNGENSTLWVGQENSDLCYSVPVSVLWFGVGHYFHMDSFFLVPKFLLVTVNSNYCFLSFRPDEKASGAMMLNRSMIQNRSEEES